jgi:hypothetical protein
MISIRTVAAVSTLAVTVFAYGHDRSVGAMSAGRGPHRNAALSEELGEGAFTPAAVPAATEDPAKPKPMTFGYCTDGDGGDNPYVASYLIDSTGGQWQDHCINAGQLVEETCGASGNSIIVVHNCTCVSEWINVPGWGSRYAGKCVQ